MLASFILLGLYCVLITLTIIKGGVPALISGAILMVFSIFSIVGWASGILANGRPIQPVYGHLGHWLPLFVILVGLFAEAFVFLLKWALAAEKIEGLEARLATTVTPAPTEDTSTPGTATCSEQ